MQRVRGITVFVASALVACALAACGGARTRVIGEHEVRWEGERQDARLAIDGRPVRVVWDEVAGAYRAPGCDFGPAATLESLAEQVVATSPQSCEPLE